MHLLEGKTEPTFKEVFTQLWYKTVDRKKNEVVLWDNENIIFGHADFDKDVLQSEDLINLSKDIEELGIQDLGSDPIEVYKAVAKIKKNPYKRIKPNQLKYFNRASWTSMWRKGHILLDSFYEQFYPKIEKVLATQKFSFIKDENTGDMIQGVVDMVLKIRGYEKPIIFDLKTASKAYTQQQIEHSDQLTLYAAMEGWKYNSDQVGYVVLSKNINKEKIGVCKECRHVKEGRHKTCNALVQPDPNWPADKLAKFDPKQRCNGEWDEKTVLKPIVQVLIQNKTNKQIEDVLEDQANIIVGMKNQTVFKNTSKCLNWYSQKCPYYEVCYNNDYSKVRKKE